MLLYLCNKPLYNTQYTYARSSSYYTYGTPVTPYATTTPSHHSLSRMLFIPSLLGGKEGVYQIPTKLSRNGALRWNTYENEYAARNKVITPYHTTLSTHPQYPR